MPVNPARRVMKVVLPAAVGMALAVPVAAGWLRAQTPAPTAPPPAPVAPGAPAAPPATPPLTTRPSPDTVIITIGDERITQGEFDQFISALHPNDQQMARGQFRRPWAESLANMKLLAREAQKRKLDQTPAVQKQLAMMRDQVLANAMVGSVQEGTDEGFLRKYFDEHRQQLERVSARHILIRTPGSPVPARGGQEDPADEAGKAKAEADAKAKAEQLAARVKAGEDFAKLAKAESDDEGSAVEGGDLGSFTRGKMVGPFEQAAFALKEGEVGQPVRSQFGWHVIQVTGRFDTYEKLADVLKQQLGPQRAQQFVQELRGQYKVQLNDAVLGPRPPADAEGGPAGGVPPGP